MTSHATPHIEKPSKIASDNPHIEKPSKLTILIDKIAKDRKERTFNIQRNNLTKCPNGLRKRNVDWNHIYSPYWINSDKNRPMNLEPEENRNFDETVTGSERSNIDHGFESFNGKSSSSEELVTFLFYIFIGCQKFKNFRIMRMDHHNMWTFKRLINI